MTARFMLLAMLALATALQGTCCTPTTPNELDKLGTVRWTINGQAFSLWIADEEAEQMRGLMFVTADQMADLPDGTKRGMLFAFDHESVHSFWMKNTVIPLDIAYLGSDGVIVATHTMAPLDNRLGQYSSGLPARYAIEVNAGVWAALGIRTGDRIEIPATLLKRIP